MHDQIMHGTLFNPFGYSRFRAHGHADLMKYYNYFINPNLFKSGEYDTKSLIWLSSLAFIGGRNEK